MSCRLWHILDRAPHLPSKLTPRKQIKRLLEVTCRAETSRELVKTQGPVDLTIINKINSGKASET